MKAIYPTYIVCACLFAIMQIRPVKSQVFQPFIFREASFLPDTVLQATANRGMNCYYHMQYDSAVVFYKQLLQAKPHYYVGYFNLAVFYARMQEFGHAMDALEKYIALSDKKCNYPVMQFSCHFNALHDSARFVRLLKLAKRKDEHRKEKVCQPSLRDQLYYLVALEQEWLGNVNMSFSERSDSIRARVFEPMLQLLDTTHLPGKRELGAATAYLGLLILHADYLPAVQVSLGKQMLVRAEDGFEPKQAAYIIDRGLRNLHLPQRYGTILTSSAKGEHSLYTVDDWNLMVERRRALHFQPIEEYIQNLNIYR
jgi:tetratricopeptide (TPR) repeat protein